MYPQLFNRPLTRPATALLARLLTCRPEDGPEKTQRAAAANSAALRRHFAELTTAFLAPFDALFQPVRRSSESEILLF